MDTTFLTATVITQDLSILVAIGVLLITPRKGRREFLVLWLALLTSFSTDALTAVRYWVFHLSSNSLITSGSMLASALYLLFYRAQFRSKRFKAIVTYIIVLDIGFALINMFFIQGVYNTTSYSFATRSIGFIIITLLYFYVLIKELPTERITKLAMFWINTSFLLYYAGVFFQWLLVDYIHNVLKGDVVNTYTIKNSLGVVHYLLIAVGLWYNRGLFLPKSTTA